MSNIYAVSNGHITINGKPNSKSSLGTIKYTLSVIDAVPQIQHILRTLKSGRGSDALERFSRSVPAFGTPWGCLIRILEAVQTNGTVDPAFRALVFGASSPTATSSGSTSSSTGASTSSSSSTGVSTATASTGVSTTSSSSSTGVSTSSSTGVSTTSSTGVSTTSSGSSTGVSTISSTGVSTTSSTSSSTGVSTSSSTGVSTSSSSSSTSTTCFRTTTAVDTRGYVIGTIESIVKVRAVPYLVKTHNVTGAATVALKIPDEYSNSTVGVQLFRVVERGSVLLNRFGGVVGKQACGYLSLAKGDNEAAFSLKGRLAPLANLFDLLMPETKSRAVDYGVENQRVDTAVWIAFATLKGDVTVINTSLPQGFKFIGIGDYSAERKAHERFVILDGAHVQELVHIQNLNSWEEETW